MRTATLGPALVVAIAGLFGSFLPLGRVLAVPATDRLTGAPDPARAMAHDLDSDGRWRWARYRAKIAAQLPELSETERALHADIEGWERALSEGEGLQHQQAYLQCLYGDVSHFSLEHRI
jgi:hypothetical protein